MLPPAGGGASGSRRWERTRKMNEIHWGECDTEQTSPLTSLSACPPRQRDGGKDEVSEATHPNNQRDFSREDQATPHLSTCPRSPWRRLKESDGTEPEEGTPAPPACSASTARGPKPWSEELRSPAETDGALPSRLSRMHLFHRETVNPATAKEGFSEGSRKTLPSARQLETLCLLPFQIPFLCSLTPWYPPRRAAVTPRKETHPSTVRRATIKAETRREAERCVPRQEVPPQALDERCVSGPSCFFHDHRHTHVHVHLRT